jgi:trigger factor
MSVQVEKLEKSMAMLTVEVSAEDFEAALNKVYKKNKNQISIPGFRRGKVSRKMVEKMYGPAVFFEEAANDIIPVAYEEALEECDVEIMSQPSINVTQIEQGKPFIFTATVAIRPEVTLGEYKGIEVEKKTAEVTEDELNAEIDRARESNSRIISVEDRAVQDGDITTIDFEGFVDGEAFEGGKGENYPLTIGSHSFIDNFEEQLIGKNIGEETEVHVTFPEQYQEESLQGKPALFKVTVKEIKVKELPELDDDFAQDVSDFDTVEEYKEDVRKKLLENKEEAIKREKEEDVVAKIVENATMEVGDPMVDANVRQMMQEFSQNLSAQGLSLQQYMQYTGQTADKMQEELRPQALKRIQSRLVLEAIVEAEKIEASEEEVEKELENMASAYQMEVEKLKELIGDEEMDRIAMDLAVRKAADFVVEASVEK